MAGTIPVSGKLTMDGLAAALTRYEELEFERVTQICADSSSIRNLLTTIDQPSQLGPLSICAEGSNHYGEKVLSATLYISGVATKIDLYRLNS